MPDLFSGCTTEAQLRWRLDWMNLAWWMAYGAER